MNELATLSISQAKQKLDAKEISSLELARACLQNIEARDTSVHAYLEVFDDVETQARRADERIAAGETGTLLGIPLALKDNILVEGRHASAGSKILEGYSATYDSTVAKKLKAAGAIFLGRTNMDEFAMGGSTENSAYGVTRNPLDETRVPGGSSGGSAAALAAHMALGSFGTDTGGSVREPASFCGVVGLKPTYGAVSRFGVIALGSSLDQVGPFGKTVADTKILFEATRGRDALDSTSIDASFYPQTKATKKIGVPRELLKEGVDADVLEAFEASLEKLAHMGYEIIDVTIPSAPLALAMYYIVMPAEASTNLARYDGVRYGLSKKGKSLIEDYALTRGEGFGPEPRRRIMLGTYVLSSGYYDAFYGKATAARTALRAEVGRALEQCDAIALPTAPCPATKIGEKADPLSMYLMDVFTVIANLTGNPAISIPSGTVKREDKTLPVGFQLIAPHGGEETLFALGAQVEHGA
jgi:aspartyl-tRNA(Asn)/glutamyl-tRNA(Gln) amidotransferase subunit A